MMEINKPKHIAPLAVLRVAFGLVLLISTIRFMAKGWVHEFYIAPRFFFPFYGFQWVRPLPAAGMYTVFVLMAVGALCITLGLFYRIASAVFFLCFVYVELLDKSYYLNHYYFVTLMSFLLLLVPAHRYFSLDVIRKTALKLTRVPAWMIDMFRLQICLVYFFAGLSKLTHEWLIEAMPLKIWLPAFGGLFKQPWVAYAFSWSGALFDLTIWIFLLLRPTRKIAYIFVVIFHVLTGWLFKIGMFPYLMIAATLVFFPLAFDDEAIGLQTPARSCNPAFRPRVRIVLPVLGVYFLLQLALPFRYMLYPGKLSWTEQGFRFSWRVMLMEKGGTAFFYIKDARSHRRWEVVNGQFLTPLQERMMVTQPDMILQYAHHLHDVYKKRGINDPVITVEDYVTLNGSGSRLYLDSTVDLAKEQESFLPKPWILPFRQP